MYEYVLMVNVVYGYPIGHGDTNVAKNMPKIWRVVMWGSYNRGPSLW